MHSPSAPSFLLPLAVLIIEDEPSDADLIEQALRRGGYHVSARVASNRSELLAALDHGFDVVLTDFNLPDLDGLEAIRLVRARGLDAPVIVISGTIGDERAAECVRAGAVDYVLKDRLNRLPFAVRSALTSHDLAREKRAAEAALVLREAHYRTMIELSLDALVILDLDGRLVFASPPIEALTGLPPTALVGAQPLDLVYPEDRPRIARILAGVIAGSGDGRLVSFRVQHQDGSCRWLEARGKNLAGDPSIGGILLTVRDVTEKAAVEDERQRLIHDLGERVKEIALLHSVSKRFESDHGTTEELLAAVASEIPAAWQYPEITAARIRFGSWTFATEGFREAPWRQSGCYPVGDAAPIEIDVVYLEQRPEADEGPFLREERRVLDSLGEMLSGHLERHAAEQSLRESEARFRQLAETIEEVFFLFDLDEQRVLYMSPGYDRIWGRARERLAAEPLSFLEAVHPDDRSKVAAVLREPPEKPVAREYRLVHGDGSVRWIRDQVSPVRDGAGRVHRIAGVARDVTDLKAAESAREYLAQIVESSADAIVGVSLGGVIVSWNRGAELLYGYSAEEALGAPLAMLYPPGEHDRPTMPLERALHGEYPSGLDARRRRKDGAVIEVSLALSPILAPDGSVAGIAGITRDVTANRRAQRSLAEQTARLERTLESMPIGVFLTDEQGRITHVNPEAARIWDGRRVVGPEGYSEYRAWIPSTGRRVEAGDWPIHRALHEGETVLGRELEIESFAGTRRTVLVSAVPICDEVGRILGAIIVNQDISDRKRFERDLAAARDEALAASRLKSAFLANVSHEIRTPLNVILGYNALIATRLEESGDTSARPLLDAVDRGGRRLLATIHRILDVAKIETGAFQIHPERLEVAPLLESYAREYEPLAKEKGLEFELRIEEPDASIVFDEYCLAQAMRNLLDNAIKFTERGGVSIVLDRAPTGAVRILVRDTGIGIDPAFHVHLFEPFSQQDMGYTRRFEGTGLGLSLTRSYLERNGAVLTVGSEEGKGSTFTIVLPTPESFSNTASTT